MIKVGGKNDGSYNKKPDCKPCRVRGNHPHSHCDIGWICAADSVGVVHDTNVPHSRTIDPASNWCGAHSHLHDKGSRWQKQERNITKNDRCCTSTG